MGAPELSSLDVSLSFALSLLLPLPPWLALDATFSRPSPPMRMSRPKPMMVLQELVSSTATVMGINNVNFMIHFVTRKPVCCKVILSDIFDVDS
jgi:hypothetical protein